MDSATLIERAVDAGSYHCVIHTLPETEDSLRLSIIDTRAGSVHVNNVIMSQIVRVYNREEADC